MWLRDTGVLVKMKYDVLKPAIPRPLPKFWKDEPLNLYQLGIMMIVFVVGIFSSILVFFVELRCTNVKSPNPEKREKKTRGLSWRKKKMIEGGGTWDKGKEHIDVVSMSKVDIF